MTPPLTATAPAVAEPKRVQPTCGSCRFYRPFTANAGVCHLMPPVLTGPEEDGPFAWQQAEVYAAGWCGQWQPQEVSE